ncbi:MAG: hypothetical protein KAV87_45600 [Desulfobacteraceae bacterium]|nr:hypothetical protein [Desulfobacteraceae bacterium]
MRKRVFNSGNPIWAVVIFFLSVLSGNWCYGQEITDVQAKGDNYQMKIDGEMYLAIPLEKVRQILKENAELEAVKKELAVLKKELVAKAELIDSYETANKAYVKNFKIKNDIIEQTNKLYEGYKDLAKGYKKLRGEAFFRFSGGVGAIRESDTRDLVPVVLLGVSMKRLNIWGYLSTNQTGFIVGANLPLRFSLF